MSTGIDDLTSGIGKAIKTVPDLYDDALKPTAQESGDVLAIVPRTIKAALAPLRQWIAQKEYNVAETEKLLAKKLENIDTEKIVTPESYVAVPAIQAISYSMDSEELRNLYANLLAKSMNVDTKNFVHPSFVEIIKQLSPLDAKVLKAIMEREVNPCINLRYENPQGTYNSIMTNVTDFHFASQALISISIDNLQKQNLIHIPYDAHYSNEYLYDAIIQSDFYKEQEACHPERPDGFKFTHEKKMISKTNLGQSFYEACILDFKS